MTGLTRTKSGTRWLFGKPYHWHQEGRYVLASGAVEDCERCVPKDWSE